MTSKRIGDRVKLTGKALEMFPKYKGRLGTIRTFSGYEMAGVKWDDLVTIQRWHAQLLRKTNT